MEVAAAIVGVIIAAVSLGVAIKAYRVAAGTAKWQRSARLSVHSHRSLKDRSGWEITVANAGAADACHSALTLTDADGHRVGETPERGGPYVAAHKTDEPRRYARQDGRGLPAAYRPELGGRLRQGLAPPRLAVRAPDQRAAVAMGAHPISNYIALDEATGERVRELLGSAQPYYRAAAPPNPARWSEQLGRRKPDGGYGEARAPADWHPLREGQPARAVSVEPGAVRWADDRANQQLGGAGHDRLFCRGDRGRDVRTGWVTSEPDGMLHVEGTERT